MVRWDFTSGYVGVYPLSFGSSIISAGERVIFCDKLQRPVFVGFWPPQVGVSSPIFAGMARPHSHSVDHRDLNGRFPSSPEKLCI